VALRNPAYAERFDQIVDTPGADAVHIRFLNHSDQGAFTAALRLEEYGVTATVPHTRHAQRKATHTRVPAPITVAIPLATSIVGSLVALSAQMQRHLDLHDLLRQHPHALAQKVHIVIEFGFAQQL